VCTARGGYREGRQDLSTPLTDFKIAPQGKEKLVQNRKNIDLKFFFPKSGCFCSKINLAPPSLKSCIRPCVLQIKACSTHGMLSFGKFKNETRTWKLEF